MSSVVTRGTEWGGVSRVVRDTYILLSSTLLVTAAVTWATLGANLGMGAYLGSIIGSFALIFVIGRMRNSGWALVAIYAFAALEGVGLGPIISHYLRTPEGSAAVSEATFLTGAVFAGLSAYVHVTKKDFSAWAGMLFAGLIIVVVASIIGLFISSSAYQLTLAAMSAILFSGLILFDTSRIVRGGETNYILATLQLYLDVLNLFLALLRLLGGGDRR